MQITVNSLNIGILRFKVQFDIQNQRVTFTDISTYNNMSGQGVLYVQGISFSLVDSVGIPLATVDFTNPSNYIVPSTTSTFVLDLINVNFAFLFQRYTIYGSIKDQDGTIYSTIPVIKDVCQPVDITDSGYVPGMFQLIPDCVNNILSVKELTLLVYNNLQPLTVTKSGTLYYPTGTISPVTFTNTPFSNNVIYTGEYRITNTTIGEYDLQDDFYVDVTYLTNCPFDVTCSDRMANILCCVSDKYQLYVKNCNNAIGANAKNLLAQVSVPLMLGDLAERNGQDASQYVSQIKSILKCDCGVTSISQNELTPVNPSVYSIVVLGVNATTVTPSQNGSTKTFTVSTNIVSVAKGNTGDVAFTIVADNSVSGNTRWLITFNYTVMAGYILTAIAGNNTLIAQLNSLVTQVTNIDLSNLNGKCIIDLSSIDYFLSQLVPDGAIPVLNIVIGSTTHNAPGGLLVSNTSGIEAWLNGLGLGTFNSSFSNGTSGSYINILTIGNSNMPVSISLSISSSPTVVLFQKTNKSLIAVLQAIIDYLCQLSALQIALGNNLSLCYFDYSGNLVVTNYTSTGNTQSDYNVGLATTICSIVNRINTLTGLTCAKIQALFQDYPNAVWSSSDRFLSIVDGNCTSLTNKQAALSFIDAINSFSDVKTAFCAIDCTAPATCPDISNISLAMSGSNIGVYGLSWNITPVASQTVTVKYRVNGTLTWTVATNALLILPNGSISGTTPFLITGVTVGTTYDVQIVNNCGGTGFTNQITTPTGTVYTGNYLLDNIIYNICGHEAVTLYSSEPFAPGVTMYSDSGLTTHVSGYTLISSPSTGIIYNLNTSTGVVGGSTGANCSSGTAAGYILATSTGAACSNTPETLYTNGVFAVGKTLYVDSSLTTPVNSSFTYVLNQGNNTIYNLASAVIGSSTGLNCSTGSVHVAVDNTVDASFVVSSITGISGFALGSPLAIGNSTTGTHSSFASSTLSFTVSGLTTANNVAVIKVAGVTVGTVNFTSGNGTYFLPDISANTLDFILITFNNGT